MYSTLLNFHSVVRWFVLVSLIYSIYRAYIGYTQNKSFSSADNAWRHWTATIAHIQLIIGIILYIKSPIVQYFWSNFSKAISNSGMTFFALIHSFLMITSVVIVTIGSALAKRKPTAKQKYKTMLVWFSIALIIIFTAIPWPFSPLANRPYFRPF
jgi:hypothetical protein